MKKAAISLLFCVASLFVLWFFYTLTLREFPTHYSTRMSESGAGKDNATWGEMSGTSGTELKRSPGTARQQHTIVQPAVADLLREPWRRLTLAELASFPSLGPAEERELIEHCREISNPTNASGLFSVLAYHGNDAAFEFLSETLTNRFRDQRLSAEQEAVLIHLVSDMGLLARRNDRAFLFLRQGLNSEFWRGSLGWLSHDAEGTIRTLMAMTLRGIAASGRPEAASILVEQREPDSDVMRLGLQGALVDSAFWLWLALNKSEQFYSSELGGQGEQVMSQFSAWRQRTSEGQEWARWFTSLQSQRQH